MKESKPLSNDMENEFVWLSEDFHIPWDLLKAEDIESNINEAIRIGINGLEEIVENPSENPLLQFEDATRALDQAWGYVCHLKAVCDSEELRTEHKKMNPKVVQFYTDIFLNDALWRTFKQFAETDYAKSLEGPYKRLLEETVLDFKSHGADLGEEDKEKLKSINSELSDLCSSFGDNVLDSTNDWELVIEKERLKGMPNLLLESALESAKEKGHPEGMCRITLHAPSLFPVLQYCEDSQVREECWRAFSQISALGTKHDNSELICKILVLRKRKAELLGKENWPDFILERRMVKNGRRALEFSTDLHGRIIKQFYIDMKALEDFGGQSPLEPWDLSFVKEKYKKEKLDFDEEEMRPYFSVDNILKGVFALAGKLYGLSFTERYNVAVWHPDVRFFDVEDDGRHIGSFYCDLHPRETKRGGAWMDSLKTSGGPNEPHLCLICGNLNKPCGDVPALLNLSEATTVLHECGHLIHGLLGTVPIRSLNGTNVVWDFVELPSQMNENWLYEPAAISLFAEHYETGNPIPDELFEKARKARSFQESTVFMRQLQFGKLDLDLHFLGFEEIEEIQKDLSKLEETIRGLTKGYRYEFSFDVPSIACRFHHLFSSSVGYAAGYYSYKWAEVLEADAFETFKMADDGPISQKVGLKFKQELLSKGNSEPPDVLFRNFTGHDPDVTPLLRRGGFTE